MRKAFQRRSFFLLLVLFGLVNACNVMAQTSPPPKKKHHVIIYLLGADPLHEAILEFLTAKGKSTSAIIYHDDFEMHRTYPFSNEGDYLFGFLKLSIDVEDGETIEVGIGNSGGFALEAWTPCADANVTLGGSFFGNYTQLNGVSINYVGVALNAYFYYDQAPFFLTVRGVSNKSSGNGPTVPPSQ